MSDILLCTVFSGCSNAKEDWENREESTEEYQQIPIRYYSDSGPIERKNIYLKDPYDQDSHLLSRLYTYQDNRLDVGISIIYPVVSSYYYIHDTEMSNKINEIIEEAFFMAMEKMF